jgi:uncharacterized protein YihD (DUF1040 family)
MRDPARIDKVLNIIRKYWKTYPDLRLTQLLTNVLGTGDNFHIEDDELVKRLDEYMAIVHNIATSENKFAEDTNE